MSYALLSQQAFMYGGRMVAEFEQTAWGQRTGTPLGGGYCLPLCCKWIECQLQRANFVTVAHSANGAREIRQMDAELSLHGSGLNNPLPDILLARRGLALECMMYVTGGVGWTRFLQENVASRGGGYYVIQYFGLTAYPHTADTETWHAIALDTYQCAYFEPAGGICAFPNGAQIMCDFVGHMIGLTGIKHSTNLEVRRYVFAPDAVNRPATPMQLTWV